jgi:hypothetical protein
VPFNGFFHGIRAAGSSSCVYYDGWTGTFKTATEHLVLAEI